MLTLKFAETHNLVAFLEKHKASNGFNGIFWATAKAKIVNGERQIQALVDKKKVIITEKSVRSDLIVLDKQVEGMSKHKGIYVTPSYTKKIFANMKREGTGRITPLFQTMMVQAPEDTGEDSAAPTDSYSTHIITQPSHLIASKEKEPISTPYCDIPQSGKDRLQLTKLMNLCTKIQKQVLDLEEAKTAQAKEIASLKKRVKQLEKRKKSRNSGLKRLRKLLLPVYTTVDELTLAQTLIEIKAAKPKAVTTSATTITTAIASTRPKAKRKLQGEMVEPEKPLKKKDQIALDEELALRLHAEEQA
ncbi:hypothetical protein Tco_1082824 [Tanacetum coccineum]|uniref:Uncharacterized protein n=1 Tax=Tanacetum coccineum TaxID=301880 RepID=A0ABQ5I2E7_9ASTR